MKVQTQYQSKNKWQSQRVQKQFKNKHHNSNYLGHSVRAQSLHNYCNQYTKNIALNKRNRPHDTSFSDHLHSDYARGYNSNNIIPCWACKQCTYCNIERNSHCTICQFPFTSNNIQNSKKNNAPSNKQNGNGNTLDAYITPLLSQKRPTKLKTEYLTEDDIDESVQIAIALSLSLDNNNNTEKNESLDAKSQDNDDDDDLDDIKTQEPRNKYSRNRLLEQRYKYQQMPAAVNQIPGIFAVGLGLNSNDNKSSESDESANEKEEPINEREYFTDNNVVATDEYEKDADELYWDEMVEIFEKMKAVKNVKRKKKMKSHKNANDLEDQAKATKEEVTLARYIGQYPELCDQIKNIEQVRKNLESNYKSSVFNIQCILNRDVAKKFLSSRGDHVGSLDLVYHGTDAKNNESIKQRGLIIGGSNGVERVHGAAYGRGVYCSPNVGTAGSYNRGSMFICLVRRHQVRRSGNIWVVPRDGDILPLYLAEFDFNNFNCSWKPQKDGPDFVPILKGSKEWCKTENFNEFASFPGRGQEIFRFFPCFRPLNSGRKQRKIQRKWSAYYKLDHKSRK